MKIRPDVKLLEEIKFAMLSEYAINGRAREYSGPKQIKYGMSVNGEGVWKNIGGCYYSEYEHGVLLDDMVFIFHKNIKELGAFDIIAPVNDHQNEFFQTNIYNARKIPLNIIGIYLEFTKYNTFSGDINMN